MKYILLFFITLSGSVFGQISHNLEIYSVDGLNFTLTVNGRQINESPVPNVQIVDIENDYVHAKITFEDVNIPPIEKKVLQIAEPGTGEKKPVSTVYRITEKKGNYKLRFASRSAKKIQEQLIHDEHMIIIRW